MNNNENGIFGIVKNLKVKKEKREKWIKQTGGKFHSEIVDRDQLKWTLDDGLNYFLSIVYDSLRRIFRHTPFGSIVEMKKVFKLNR